MSQTVHQFITDSSYKTERIEHIDYSDDSSKTYLMNTKLKNEIVDMFAQSIDKFNLNQAKDDLEQLTITKYTFAVDGTEKLSIPMSGKTFKTMYNDFFKERNPQYQDENSMKANKHIDVVISQEKEDTMCHVCLYWDYPHIEEENMMEFTFKLSFENVTTLLEDGTTQEQLIMNFQVVV